MQSRPSIAEFDNLAKRCEFLTEKNLQLRSQLSLLQGQIDLLQDDRVLLQQTNQEMVRKLQQIEQRECQSPRQPLSRSSSRNRVCRLSDGELRRASESSSTDFNCFCADNLLQFDKNESPRFGAWLHLVDRRLEQVKAITKTLSSSSQKAVSHGRAFYEQLKDLQGQLDKASRSLSDSQEISLLLKYFGELVGQYSRIGSTFVKSLQRCFTEQLIALMKNDLEPPKDLRKRYQKQSEEYEALVTKIPTFTRETALINYSGYLKGYFTGSQQFEQARISVLESCNLQLLKLNETLTGSLVESLSAVKKQFNDHREFIGQLQDICLLLDSCRLKKQQSHRALLLNSVNELRTGQSKSNSSCDIEGFLFLRRDGTAFERRYFSIQNHRLFQITQEKYQLVKKDILPLELTNLRLSSQPYLNCFELESPGLRGSLLFVAETEYHLKEWCAAIRKNIELKISTVKVTDPRTAKEDVKKMDKLIAEAVCADCGGPNPSWISTNFLVMVCLQCSGYHRKLGLSRIRSLKLDVTDPQTLQLLQQYGNEQINRILEGKLSNITKPTPNSEGKDKQAWIRQKYVQRKFTDWHLVPSCPELQGQLAGDRKLPSQEPISEPTHSTKSVGS